MFSISFCIPCLPKSIMQPLHHLPPQVHTSNVEPPHIIIPSSNSNFTFTALGDITTTPIPANPVLNHPSHQKLAVSPGNRPTYYFHINIWAWGPQHLIHLGLVPLLFIYYPLGWCLKSLWCHSHPFFPSYPLACWPHYSIFHFTPIFCNSHSTFSCHCYDDFIIHLSPHPPTTTVSTAVSPEQACTTANIASTLAISAYQSRPLMPNQYRVPSPSRSLIPTFHHWMLTLCCLNRHASHECSWIWWGRWLLMMKIFPFHSPFLFSFSPFHFFLCFLLSHSCFIFPFLSSFDVYLLEASMSSALRGGALSWS